MALLATSPSYGSVVRASDRWGKVIDSIPVGDSDFFFVLCSWHVDHIITRGEVFIESAWLHDTGATFAPARVHSGSISWLYICLHDTTTTCHASASHPGVSSSRLLYRSENFTPVRNIATLSCKRETSPRFGVKSVCRWTGTGSAFVRFAILNRTCILSPWSKKID